jgi:hypothetical protein
MTPASQAAAADQDSAAARGQARCAHIDAARRAADPMLIPNIASMKVSDSNRSIAKTGKCLPC